MRCGLSLVLMAVCLSPVLRGGAVEFFVAPTGNDGQAGTKTQPFATLERAREAVRQQKSMGAMPAGGITVWLRGGDYPRTNAFELLAVDSGIAGNPVVWRAWPGETPRLLGGVVLPRFQPVTDPKVLERIDEKARSSVRQVNLSALGRLAMGELKSRGFGRSITPAHGELFYQGQPMILARWPNVNEWAKIAGFPEAQAQPDGHGGRIGKLTEGFFFAGDRPRRWQANSDLWVHGYWSWDWANSYERVASIQPEEHWIKTAPPYGLYGFRQGQRFYFLNILEELDSPGEWFFDRPTGLLYFWPPEATHSAGSTEALLSTLAQPLIRMTDVSQVVVRGLTLVASRGNGLEIHGGASNRVADCVMRNLGNYGVMIEGGQGHGVVHGEILDTGDGGVSLRGGDRKTLQPAGHYVEDCHFARQGRWSKCYVPAILMNGVGLRASHNLIHDHPHCAILFNGNDHLIEFNEIHHIALETGDVGAIYTGRDYTYRGNRIRHNYLHHTGGVGMGSMGIYMDDCVSGTEIYGNIFYQVQRAVFLGGGRDHQVVNNIFVECNHAVELDGRGLDPSPVWHDMVDDTLRHLLTEVPLSLYRERYPDLLSLDAYYGAPGGPAITGVDFKGVPPENHWIARNICVGKWLNINWQAKPGMMRLENNLTNANPGFVGQPRESARAMDFDLQSDSPAWKLGFQAIPTGQIGPRSH